MMPLIIMPLLLLLGRLHVDLGMIPDFIAHCLDLDKNLFNFLRGGR